MNIQDVIGKGFMYREIAYSIIVNAYLGPRRTNKHMQNLTMDLKI